MAAVAWQEEFDRAMAEFDVLEVRYVSWSPALGSPGPISPEHNYHDLGAGMLIDELLGTIDKAIGEYEG